MLSYIDVTINLSGTNNTIFKISLQGACALFVVYFLWHRFIYVYRLFAFLLLYDNIRLSFFYPLPSFLGLFCEHLCYSQLKYLTMLYNFLQILALSAAFFKLFFIAVALLLSSWLSPVHTVFLTICFHVCPFSDDFYFCVLAITRDFDSVPTHPYIHLPHRSV